MFVGEELSVLLRGVIHSELKVTEYLETVDFDVSDDAQVSYLLGAVSGAQQLLDQKFK